MKSKYQILAKSEDKVTIQVIEFDQETEIHYGYEDRLQIVEVQQCKRNKVLAVFSNEISIIKIK
jgi:hypothetical protein